MARLGYYDRIILGLFRSPKMPPLLNVDIVCKVYNGLDRIAVRSSFQKLYDLGYLKAPGFGFYRIDKRPWKVRTFDRIALQREQNQYKCNYAKLIKK